MSSAQPPALNRPRIRAVVFGLVLVVGLAFLMPYINLSLRKYDWAFRPLPTGPLFVLFVLIWPVNTLLRRARQAWAFTGPELLLVYAMMALCAGLAYEGLWGYALDYSVYPFYAATPENRWGDLIVPHIPTWLQVSQAEAVRGFFEGMPEAPAPYHLWLTPILSWSVFAFALYLFLFSLGSLLRKDWIEAERLSFPIAAVPIEMAGHDTPTIASALFRSPFLWAGFALPVFQSLLQMAHALAPAVPYSRMYSHLGRWFVGQGPWDALSGTTAYVGFDTIGLFGLLPVEVSLSLWFFYLLNRVQLLTFAVLGYGQEGFGARLFSPDAFVTYQEAGGCLMLAALLVWRSRVFLGSAFGSLVGRASPYDPGDPVSRRGAALGLVTGGIVMALWARRAGCDLLVFAGFMGVSLAYWVAMARLVAAGGVYVPDVSLFPRDLLTGLTGAARFSPQSLTVMGLIQGPFVRIYKLNLLHFFLNDLKIMHSARLPGRLAAACLWLALALMIAIVPWVILHYAYRDGSLNFDAWLFRDAGNVEFGQLASSLSTPEAPMAYLPSGLAFGAAVMAALTWLNSRFVWWSLSPIGFVLGGTWGLGQRMWASAFIAWLAVVSLRKVGGLRLYRTVRPMFLGMVIGHLVIMGFRSLFDPLLGLRMHLAAWE
jgi:hypothetical protein